MTSTQIEASAASALVTRASQENHRDGHCVSIEKGPVIDNLIPWTLYSKFCPFLDFESSPMPRYAQRSERHFIIIDSISEMSRQQELMDATLGSNDPARGKFTRAVARQIFLTRFYLFIFLLQYWCDRRLDILVGSFFLLLTLFFF